MHILMLSDVYFPRINGVSTSIQTFRREMTELDHRITLVVPEYPVAVDDDDDVIRVPARYLPLDPEDRLLKWKPLMALLPVIQARGPIDLVHIQTPFVMHYAGIRLAKALNTPVIETYHTYFEEYLYHYLPFFTRGALRALARKFSRSQCNQVNSVIVPSSPIAEAMQRYGVETPLQIIPTGIDFGRFSGGDGAAFRQRHGIDEGRPVILNVSRVAHEKNIDFLLRMFRLVLKKQPDTLFMLAGEGPALGHLQKLAKQLGIQDSMRFFGYMDRNTELLDCYAAADVFVFASRTETQGLVLLEAMALGTPVVSTAVLGTKDVLQDQHGALIAEDDLGNFSDRVLQVLGNPVLRQHLSDSGRLYVQNWSAREMAQRQLGFYQEVLSRHAPLAGKRSAVLAV